MIAYIKMLQKYAAATSRPPQPLSLRQKFLDWFHSLPEFTRNRPFSMSEFETALKTQGRYIGPVLHGLGWRRKRFWGGTTGPYRRAWVPPQRSD
jgi:hypothetical protein